MTAWAQSLIRISNYEVETLQKRLAEVAARKAEAEMRVAVLDAEVEIERQNARLDPTSGMMLQAYLKGWALKRADAEGVVAAVSAEEEGARDALTSAFEELKKFEHVAEATRLSKLLAAAKRETAAFDEMGLRRRAGG
ncbi:MULTISPECIES: flagellar export protein FliJ [unclassified Brevundimonas]|uniref:flagellar export protein FliJ n=1 Tax=unclassified Brevundimonas TaxID=2622653 RepID=UPI000CFB18A4|nr:MULTISPECIES: flagellar export protein FliJ [unclassified Brevundimonas]PRA21295.1 flagellar export protein FliJ [Brevundimonas sp. MYb27]PQZ73236.1 flagellar export protein FliJ [Brevundimonas sp. MYb31]PRB15429.1 flagellar export protein FliJ [Brevundimonas sp. MYb52]PRB32520.1 flagellar export protein FliJ [Brevundimonas sp. MYb46]PRB40518.1 flagellar export protein FliJ [Brevundimonas sp. MYb33]